MSKGRISDLVKKGGVVLEVTVKRLYVFGPDHTNGWTATELVKNVFYDFSINRSHASRDAARVGCSDIIKHIRIVGFGETTELEDIDKEKKEVKAKRSPNETALLAACKMALTQNHCTPDCDRVLTKAIRQAEGRE